MVEVVVEDLLQLLSFQPQLGRIPDEEYLVRMGYRLLVVLDYLIFYALEEQTILLHWIVHGARDYLRLS